MRIREIFIVADHVHHYSELSLRYMLLKAGFEIVEIDNVSHFGAYIVIAKNSSQQLTFKPEQQQLEEIQMVAHNLAQYWTNLQSKINEFENATGDRKAVIYGAGVYGNFIATSLNDFNKIDSFIDQNPLLQGKEILNKPVKLPANIPGDIEIIYVALNPATARKTIKSLHLDKNKYSFFYL